MVVIRLSRAGAKKRPFFHVVVTNSRNARDGRYIERIGYYNPIAKGSDVKIQLNNDRINYWISKGAQTSGKVDYLIKNFAEIANCTIEEQKTKERGKEIMMKKQTAVKAAEESIKKETKTEMKKEESPKEEPKIDQDQKEQK